MNIGKDNRHPKYICDKCGNEIAYIGKKGFVGINRYCKNTYRDQVYKKDFDLCCSCEKKFRKWLSEKEIPRIEDVLDDFPRWEG
jgi:ribosomal protein S14